MPASRPTQKGTAMGGHTPHHKTLSKTFLLGLWRGRVPGSLSLVRSSPGTKFGELVQFSPKEVKLPGQVIGPSCSPSFVHCIGSHINIRTFQIRNRSNFTEPGLFTTGSPRRWHHQGHTSSPCPVPPSPHLGTLAPGPWLFQIQPPALRKPLALRRSLRGLGARGKVSALREEDRKEPSGAWTLAVAPVTHSTTQLWGDLAAGGNISAMGLSSA